MEVLKTERIAAKILSKKRDRIEVVFGYEVKNGIYRNASLLEVLMSIEHYYEISTENGEIAIQSLGVNKITIFDETNGEQKQYEIEFALS